MELNDKIKELLDKVEDKELIDCLVDLNNSVNTFVEEHEQLLTKHAELKKSYKDAVMHTSFKEAPKTDVVETKIAPNFDDMLNKYLK